VVHPVCLADCTCFLHHCNNRFLYSWQFFSTPTLAASMTGAGGTCQKTANIFDSLLNHKFLLH